MSKSDHVRRYVAQHRAARPKEIYEALTAEGLDVSKALVNQVLYGAGSKRKKRRGGRRAKVHAVANGSSSLSLEHLIAAKKLATQLGSVESAKQAVDALAKLSG